MKLSLITTYFLAFALNSSVTQAQMMGLDFYRVTGNASENIASQLGAQVRDTAQAQTDFSGYADEDNYLADMAGNEVLFTFTNTSLIASTISEIYFDDGTIFDQTHILNNLGGFTKYTDGGNNGVNPGNLPSGNNVTPIFEATADFGADTTGKKNNGVNASNDIVGIIIQLQSGVGFTELQYALADGTLRLGLHVSSIGEGSDSDAFVNNPLVLSAPASPVPLPAAAWLFGPALLVAARKRRKA